MAVFSKTSVCLQKWAVGRPASCTLLALALQIEYHGINKHYYALLIVCYPGCFLFTFHLNYSFVCGRSQRGQTEEYVGAFLRCFLLYCLEM